jgi:hypothetical protein
VPQYLCQRLPFSKPQLLNRSTCTVFKLFNLSRSLGRRGTPRLACITAASSTAVRIAFDVESSAIKLEDAGVSRASVLPVM